VKAYCIERLGLDDVQYLVAKKRVPIHRTSHFYFLGGMALFLFVIQIITGILLSLYYKPSPDQAFESVRTIMTEIDYGWLIRSIHSWSANLLIGVLLLHVLTTYIMRAYRRPREATWVTGILLLGIFFAFGFSGYLLPWNQLAFFATRVGTQIVGAVPLIGHQMLLVARSGEEVTGDTLARFYSLHVVILPLLTLGLLGVHLYLIQKHGMSIPQGEIRRKGGAERVPSIPFVPDFLLRDMVGWYIALGLLAALAALFPWELGQKASPFESAPEGIKPEWYFLFMFETLKQLPAHVAGIEGELVGVMFFGLCGLIVLLVPALDWRAERESRRSILNFLATLCVFGFILQTISGLDLVRFQLWQSCVLSLVATVVLWLGVTAVCRLYGKGQRPTTLLAWFLVLGVLMASVARAAEGPSSAAPPPKSPRVNSNQDLPAKPNNCLFCHGNKDVWEGDQLRLCVTENDFGRDVHSAVGLRCSDCHGGNPAAEMVNEAHAQEDGFRNLRSVGADGTKDFSKPPEPAKIVELCGECHANIEFMKKFQPSPRVDQLREYWTSGHGLRVKASGDPNVATCVSCHGRPHGSGGQSGHRGVLAVKNLDSPVYVTNIANTCAECHSNAKLMAKYQYQGRPIGHQQYEQWRQSIHGKALLDKGDLSAPTCNNCHGNHGALPPQVGSVANACGTCHGKIAGLFNKTLMRHAFEQVGLPGCATCHSSHKIESPTDDMLGVSSAQVCSRCHGEKASQGAKPPALARFDAKRILHGGEVARALRNNLESLKREVAQADEKLANADRLGMLVPGPQSNPRLDPRIYLNKANDALTNARVEIHTFDTLPVEKIINQGQAIAKEVQASADRAIEEYHFRRIWLAGSLVPITLVVLLLLRYIRRLPAPE
jgi:cytochrome b6